MYHRGVVQADDIELSSYDASAGSDYLSALNEDASTFSPASLQLSAESNSVTYATDSGFFDDKGLRVQLIGNDQYVQRFDRIGLAFSDSEGIEFDEWYSSTAIQELTQCRGQTGKA